jgi:hypothetical protein
VSPTFLNNNVIQIEVRMELCRTGRRLPLWGVPRSSFVPTTAVEDASSGQAFCSPFSVSFVSFVEDIFHLRSGIDSSGSLSA